MQISEPRVVLTWLKGCYRCNKRRWKDLSYLVTCTCLVRHTVENPRGSEVPGAQRAAAGQAHPRGKGIRNTSPNEPRDGYVQWVNQPSEFPAHFYTERKLLIPKSDLTLKDMREARGNRKRWDAPAGGGSPRLLQLWLLLMQSLQDVHEEAAGKMGRREHVCHLQHLKCAGKYRSASGNTDRGHSLQFSNLKYHWEERAERNGQSTLARPSSPQQWQCFVHCQGLHSKWKTCCPGSCPAPTHPGLVHIILRKHSYGSALNCHKNTRNVSDWCTNICISWELGHLLEKTLELNKQFIKQNLPFFF